MENTDWLRSAYRAQGVGWTLEESRSILDRMANEHGPLRVASHLSDSVEEMVVLGLELQRQGYITSPFLGDNFDPSTFTSGGGI